MRQEKDDKWYTRTVEETEREEEKHNEKRKDMLKKKGIGNRERRGQGKENKQREE